MSDEAHDGPPREGDTWIGVQGHHGVVHVYPIDDLREHDCSGGNCWCGPDLDEEDNILIHHSADGREAYEEGTRKPH